MNTNFYCLCALVLKPFVLLAQVELKVEQPEISIHIAEPVIQKVKLKNTGKAPLSGAFNLTGEQYSFGIKFGKVGDKPTRFYNYAMWSASLDDGWFPPTTLTPDTEKHHLHVVHFNERPQNLVFAEAGKYTIEYSLAWQRDPAGRNVKEAILTCVAKVNVLPWDPEKDKRQIEALAIWIDPELASYVQNGGGLKPNVEAKLRKLTMLYANTLYGRLAAKALANPNTTRSPLIPSAPAKRESPDPRRE